MTPLWWSVLLSAIGILGIYLAGRNNHLGWLVGFGAQFLWLCFALTTQQYGFIFSAVAYGTVYYLNWKKWKEAKAHVSATGN